MADSATIAILANGAPPEGRVPRALFRTADWLVCCDGAYTKARALGREPDLVVGDGDSLPAADKASLGARFLAVREQDTNDLAKAVRVVLGVEHAPVAPPPCTRLIILGATGLREDHTLGNIFHLFEFTALARTRLPPPRVEMVTETGVFEIIDAPRTLACAPGEAVSLFAPDPATRIHSTGLAWPLDGVTFPNLWCATLNRTTSTAFTVAPDRPVLLFRASQP